MHSISFHCASVRLLYVAVRAAGSHCVDSGVKLHIIRFLGFSGKLTHMSKLIQFVLAPEVLKAN